MELVGLEASKVQKLWPSLRSYFESFASRSNGRYSAETLRRSVIEKDMQCWVAQDEGQIYACGLTEVQTTDTGQKWGHMGFLAGRERKRWVALADELLRIARSNGMDGLTVHCRLGWAKFMKQKGFEETHRIFEVKF